MSLLFSGNLSICASGSKMFVLIFQNNSLNSLHCGFFPINKIRIVSKHFTIFYTLMEFVVRMNVALFSPVASKKHYYQSTLRSKGFGIHHHIVVHYRRKSGQELTWRRPRRKACYLWLAQPAFLYNPGLPAQEWPHPQSPWAGPSHQSLIQKTVKAGSHGTQLKFPPVRQL